MEDAMKFFLRLLPLFLLAAHAMGQVTIVSTSPTNGQTNVPLTTTITITFSTPIDTNATKQAHDFAFANIHSGGEPYFSSDGTQFIANVQLDANTAYFIMFVYVKALNGSTLASPHVFYFTTGSTFPSNSVSGTVLPGETGVSPENAIVGLNAFDITQGGDNGGDEGPDFVMMAKVNSDGTFTIPYVRNGTYWPIAAKDVNGDGQINPDDGDDVVALGDSIVVNNANVTGVNLTFLKFTPLLFSEAVSVLPTYAATLPSGSALKYVQSWEVDTLGRGRQWEFLYYHQATSKPYVIRISPVEGGRVDSLHPEWYTWITNLTTITNAGSAASSETVLANVEAAGGTTFRRQQGMGQYYFQIQMALGDQANSRFWYLPRDPSKQYWGVSYTFYNRTNDTNWVAVSEKGFLCDFTTGTVEASGSPTSVERKPGEIPTSPALHQNYPNPFNPTTVINYSVPVAGFVALRVFDVLGREVATLVNEQQAVGNYSATFNASGLPSGMYLYRLTTGGATMTKKMSLVK
jgi:hypothetical protein